MLGREWMSFSETPNIYGKAFGFIALREQGGKKWYTIQGFFLLFIKITGTKQTLTPSISQDPEIVRPTPVSLKLHISNVIYFRCTMCP